MTETAHYREAVGKTWGAGGPGYDEISYMVSDALAHAAQRLSPIKGEKVLDVATGTGWTARNLARYGAEVTAIDLAHDLLGYAKILSAHMRPIIDFEYADAQEMPFEDGEFDVVASTFGVMFAADHERAARELARVCKSGGRLCLTTWPVGFFTDFFAMTAKYSTKPPPEPSPGLWGDPEHVRSLLGDFFALSFETGVNRSYHPHSEQLADLYVTGFGPVKELYDSLDEAGQNRLFADLVEFHEREGIETEAGLRMEREYLLTYGIRF